MKFTKRKGSIEVLAFPWYFLVFGAGVGNELWYTTRAEGTKLHHLIQWGFISFPSPKKDLEARLMTISFLYFNFKISQRAQNTAYAFVLS